jgi:hypothetical protein
VVVQIQKLIWFVCHRAGLDVTEDVQICKSGSETRAKQDVARTTSGRNIVHLRVARVAMVLSINNFIYQLEEHFSGAGRIKAEAFIFMYR